VPKKLEIPTQTNSPAPPAPLPPSSQTALGRCSISIFPAKCELTRETDAWGEMDPYIIYKLKGQSIQTSVIEEGGKTPVFDHKKDTRVFEFPGSFTEKDVMNIVVMDSDGPLSKDDIVGSSTILFSSILGSKELQKVEVRFSNDNEDVGVIVFDV
jgi:Ca2+-dependent lipid-binding protein